MEPNYEKSRGISQLELRKCVEHTVRFLEKNGIHNPLDLWVLEGQSYRIGNDRLAIDQTLISKDNEDLLPRKTRISYSIPGVDFPVLELNLRVGGLYQWAATIACLCHGEVEGYSSIDQDPSGNNLNYRFFRWDSDGENLIIRQLKNLSKHLH